MNKLYTICPLLFFILMSYRCEEKEGPITAVKGRVEDFSTGEGLQNISLHIVRKSGALSGKSTYVDLDTVNTDQFGNYELEFIPVGDGQFYVALKDYNFYELKPEYSGRSGDIILGKENIIDFKMSRLVVLGVRLKNISDFGYERFMLRAECCLSYNVQKANIVKDTTFYIKVPRLKNITFSSTFLQDGKNPIIRNTTFYIPDKDTLVNIIN